MFGLKEWWKKLTAKWALAKAGKGFIKSLEDEATEEFLKALLNLMNLAFIIDPDYRENIKNFKGSYRFMDRTGAAGGEEGVNVLVAFDNGEMEISEDPGPEANVTVTFKDSAALRNFLLSFKKDILKVILNNEIQFRGNLNYLYKFIYMANHPIHPLLNLANKLS
jgi:hypothetical protein